MYGEKNLYRRQVAGEKLKAYHSGPKKKMDSNLALTCSTYQEIIWSHIKHLPKVPEKELKVGFITRACYNALPASTGCV